jgi:hypothetical protein
VKLQPHSSAIYRLAVVVCSLFVFEIQTPRDSEAADPLTAIKSQADLDGLIGSTQNAALRQALKDRSAEILVAAAAQPAIGRVTAKLDEARGTYEKMNTTPADLQAALGGPSAVFDTLKSVNLAATGLTIKEKRTTDPFDQTFYEDLARVPGLETINIINTTAENAWLAPLAGIPSLKILRITNQSKLDDAGLALLAPLRQLESFGYVGTKMTGAPFRDFKGWTNLKTASFRGSKMSDEGLIALCEAFPNLKSLVLAHGQFSDVAVAHLASLKQLTGLEIGSHHTTPAALKHITALPLEYLQLGDGLDASEGIRIIAGIKTLKRLTLTNSKPTTDDDLRVVAGMKHLDHVELGNLEITEARIPVLAEFAFLKSMRLVRRPQPYEPELQAKLKAALPNTALAFE